MDPANQDPLPSGYTSDKFSEEGSEGSEGGIEAIGNGTVSLLPVNLTCPIRSDSNVVLAGTDIVEYSNNLQTMDDIINIASPANSPTFCNAFADDFVFPEVSVDDLDKWAREMTLPEAEVKSEPGSFTILDSPSVPIDMESNQDLEQYINPLEVSPRPEQDLSVPSAKKERRPGGRRPLKSPLSKYIDDDELCSLSTRELNLRLKNVPAEDVLMLKSRRRTIKNRGYAMNCRNRRSMQQQSVVQTVAELQQEVERLREENERLRDENQEVRAENDEFNNILRQRGIASDRRYSSLSNCSSVASPEQSITCWDAMLSPGLPSSPE